jgi:hypothetical protein
VTSAAVKNYYELLSIPPDSGADEIKRAFRREIARYHPDKVAHLGPEFLQIAEGRAAELTEAYRILTSPSERAEYDVLLRQAPGEFFPPPPPPRSADPPAPPPPADTSPWIDTPAPSFQEERANRDELVRRAGLVRFREALLQAVGRVDVLNARGFDVFHARARRPLFGKAQPPLRVLARFVSTVDAAAVDEAWGLALKAGPVAGAVSVIFLMGSGLAPAAALAARVAELRRKARGHCPVIVPVDVRDWEALIPTDAPPGVREILAKLKKPS